MERNFIEFHVKKGQDIYQMFWMNEDKVGIYWGFFSKNLQGLHYSYHKDGNSWYKQNQDKKDSDPIKRIPIESINRFSQVYWESKPNKPENELFFRKNINSSTNKVVLLNSSDFKEVIGISVDIVNKNYVSEFITKVPTTLIKSGDYKLITLVFIELNTFNNHRVAISSFAEN